MLTHHRRPHCSLRNLRSLVFIFILFSFELAIVFQPSNAFSQDDETEWKLAKEKDGIEIYTRKIEGYSIKEYKSISAVEASPEELLDIMIDVESYIDWMANVKETKMVKHDVAEKFYVYTEVEVPWPFDNRDEVSLSEVSRVPETGAIKIQISIVESEIPEKKGVIRLTEGEGVWIFTPLADGTTEIYHQFAAEPGGSIPTWLANMFLVDGPYKTMLGLKEFVALSRAD